MAVAVMHVGIVRMAVGQRGVLVPVGVRLAGRIPDLGSLGVVLPPTTSYSWAILAVGPWSSVDDFAGGTGLLPTGATTLNESLAGTRAFTTQ